MDASGMQSSKYVGAGAVYASHVFQTLGAMLVRCNLGFSKSWLTTYIISSKINSNGETIAVGLRTDTFWKSKKPFFSQWPNVHLSIFVRGVGSVQCFFSIDVCVPFLLLKTYPCSVSPEFTLNAWARFRRVVVQMSKIARNMNSTSVKYREVVKFQRYKIVSEADMINMLAFITSLVKKLTASSLYGPDSESQLANFR
jgi:hypothetical protein